MYLRPTVVALLGVSVLLATGSCSGGGGGGGGASPTAPSSECQDGVDNDGDGLVDFPDDPGCDSTSDVSEVDPDIEPSLEFVRTERDKPCGALVGRIASDDAGGVVFFMQYSVGVRAEIRVFHINMDNERIAGITGTGALPPAANREVAVRVGSEVAMETRATVLQLTTLAGALLAEIEVPCGFVYVI